MADSGAEGEPLPSDANNNAANKQPPNAAKISLQQYKKLQDANAKYKSLLMLAKERIQQQEEELDTVRHEKTDLEERVAKAENENSAGRKKNNDIAGFTDDGNSEDEIRTIVRVCQRVKSNEGENGLQEIWALFEIEISPSESMADLIGGLSRRVFEWKSFHSESELQDYIRRDTGEPLRLPPYSLSPEQSARIEEESSKKVSQVTDEFRRFRVRAELARKQADAQIRDLQNNHVQSTARRIEGHDASNHEPDHSRDVSGQVERLKAELASQESHWKEAYEMLLAENNALKSKGSEALLASQWRQRYESCNKEREELEVKLKAASSKAENSDASKYEAKYKDLKESFRLYRKKAKEIFEAQERGAVVSPDTVVAPNQPTSAFNESSSAEAKLSYLKNLMFNYLTTDQGIREHMEGAISTVLKFSPDEISRIEKKKVEHESWF